MDTPHQSKWVCDALNIYTETFLNTEAKILQVKQFLVPPILIASFRFSSATIFKLYYINYII